MDRWQLFIFYFFVTLLILTMETADRKLKAKIKNPSKPNYANIARLEKELGISPAPIRSLERGRIEELIEGEWVPLQLEVTQVNETSSPVPTAHWLRKYRNPCECGCSRTLPPHVHRPDGWWCIKCNRTCEIESEMYWAPPDQCQATWTVRSEIYRCDRNFNHSDDKLPDQGPGSRHTVGKMHACWGDEHCDQPPLRLTR